MALINDRQISITLSGNEDNNIVHDTKQKVNFLYIFQGDGDPDTSEFFIQEKERYEDLLKMEHQGRKTVQPILLNFTEEERYKVTFDSGIFPLGGEGNYYSFLRQEYVEDDSVTPSEIIYKGDWSPVAININNSNIVDYNISNGRKYKYIIYPTAITGQDWYEQYANEDNDNPNGTIIETNWDCWSLTELVPVKATSSIPGIKKYYQVPTDGVWLFKYGVETGEQVQNFIRSEQQNLSAFPRYSQGKLNYLSGSVNCKLGSEIVPYTEGYIERLKSSITKPLSSNDKVDMLKAWRRMIFSKNPKILKDRKGQALLVTITANSNKPFDAINNQPDQISFSWSQIGSLEETIIIGE